MNNYQTGRAIEFARQRVALLNDYFELTQDSVSHPSCDYEIFSEIVDIHRARLQGYARSLSVYDLLSLLSILTIDFEIVRETAVERKEELDAAREAGKMSDKRYFAKLLKAKRQLARNV